MRFTPAVGVGSIVVLTATLASAPASATNRQVGVAPVSAATAHAAPRTHKVVTLPTGDRVDVTTDAAGRPQATVGKPQAGSAPFHTFRVGPHLYVVPRSAAPQVGHSMTLSQFDVTAPGTPIVTPNFPMKTLTVHGIDAAGKPSSVDAVNVVNVDDVQKLLWLPGFLSGHR